MANEHPFEQEATPLSSSTQASSHTIRFAVVLLVLAALIVGEIYTLHNVSMVRRSFAKQSAAIQKTYATELSDRFAALERSNNQQFEAIKAELDTTAKRMGSTGKQLGRARSMVTQLQKDQTTQTESLKEEIAKKADQEQFLALTQDVSATKNNLEGTKKSLDSLSNDLGMAKSEFGTLVARNHDEIEQLRRLGDRDYTEFTLQRNQPQRIAGIGLNLKKANVKRHRFNLNLTADDMEIEKKDRTVNEPVFFYVAGSKKPYELVVNKVESNRIVGYISTPKGATQMAARSEGAQ